MDLVVIVLLVVKEDIHICAINWGLSNELDICFDLALGLDKRRLVISSVVIQLAVISIYGTVQYITQFRL